MKKNLTLISLMLGVMLLVGVSGCVNATECVGEECPQPCIVVVDQPSAGEYYDPVTIQWHYEGDCDPIEYDLFYQLGTCDGDGWVTIEDKIDPDIGNDNLYDWDVTLMPSGIYCIAANMDQENSNDVTGHSGLWYLDLASPEVSLSVGDNKVGECDEEETGDCYVSQSTPITLGCLDNVPPEAWQSGVDYIQYKINDGEWQLYGGPFTFEEDSEHTLEYRCYDNVGKVDSESKDFIVNSEGPIISKEVGEPKVDASSVFQGFDWFVNGDTQICLSAVKGNSNHPTPGNITITCDYSWYIGYEGSQWSGEVTDVLDEQGCFSYAENSFHELVCTATDALGNSGTLTEKDVVNLVAPTTTLSYTGPQYGCFPKWIDTESRVVLTAIQGNPGHPTPGDIATYYRTEIVDDSWCDGTSESQWQETSKESQDWAEYTEPFGLDESCHVIEYYSVDALGNSEDVNVRFVFSDHTAPEAIKEVGEPRDKCIFGCTPLENWYENPELDIDYEITMDTPIYLSCEDQAPHPSGVGDVQSSGIMYRIVMDGEYDNPVVDWTLINSDEAIIHFTEESEHLLEFYCIDNVGKESEIDSEIFKVTGHSFDLIIDDKWDLISVPFNLLNADVDAVFGGNDAIKSVWGYEDGVWLVYYPDDLGSSTLTEILPGHGYWVKTDDGTTIKVGGELFSPQTTPSSVEVTSGWNLIGKYGTDNYRTSYCDLFSLVNGVGFPQWSALWGYNAPAQSFIPMDTFDSMTAGNGYWLGMREDGTYFPSSVCYYGVD